MVGSDESWAHGADHNVVFLNLGSEAVKETHDGMLGGCIWKKDQPEMCTGRDSALLPWGCTLDKRADSSGLKATFRLPGLDCYN